MEHILCYLQGALGRGILHTNHNHSRIECFSDSDWAGCKMTRRSITGHCVFVGGNRISWISKQQHFVPRSSVDAEYRAMSQSACEILSIYHLWVKLASNVSIPFKLYCDNQAALHIYQFFISRLKTSS